MFEEGGGWSRTVYIAMAAFAGSVTALSFMNYRKMDKIALGLTVFTGFGFAIYGAPFLASVVFHIDQTGLGAACAVVYGGGTVGNAVIPPLIRRAIKWAQGGEEPNQ